MAQKKMTEEQKTKEQIRAEEKYRKAEAELAKARADVRDAKRKADNARKYMMGGVVWKYFPDCVEFTEHEMNRILGCAFSLKDVQNMIRTVRRERGKTVEEQKTENAENTSEQVEGNEAENQGGEGNNAESGNA